MSYSRGSEKLIDSSIPALPVAVNEVYSYFAEVLLYDSIIGRKYAGIYLLQFRVVSEARVG